MSAPSRARSASVPASSPAARAQAINRHLGKRVKQLRSSRGWALDATASASGVSKSMLSQIEREHANPTLAVTQRIAQAFGMTLGELIEMPDATSTVTVIRSDDKTYHYRSDKSCRIRTLSPLNLEKDVEFYEVRLQPGGELRGAAHFDGTREYLALHQGEVRVESAGDSERLHPGDSSSYRADVPHAVVNTGETEALCFLVVIYR